MRRVCGDPAATRIGAGRVAVARAIHRIENRDAVHPDPHRATRRARLGCRQGRRARKLHLHGLRRGPVHEDAARHIRVEPGSDHVRRQVVRVHIDRRGADPHPLHIRRCRCRGSAHDGRARRLDRGPCGGRTSRRVIAGNRLRKGRRVLCQPGRDARIRGSRLRQSAVRKVVRRVGRHIVCRPAGTCAVVLQIEDVRKHRRGSVLRQRHKVGVGSVGILGRDREAAIVLVQIAGPGHIVVVFHVASERKFRADVRPVLRACQVLLHGRMKGQRPCGQGVPLGDVPQRKPGLHAPDRAFRIGRIRVAVRPVNRIAVERPSQYRRMSPARSLFHVFRAEAPRIQRDHVVIQLRAQTNGIEMVVIRAHTRLVAVTQVESFQFSEGRVPRPDAISAGAARSAGTASGSTAGGLGE